MPVRLAPLLLALCLAAPAGAQTIAINFDTAPGGGSVANGTVVNALYTSIGVTFSLALPGGVCNSGNIYANNDRPADFTISSPPNVVSTCSPPQASDISESNLGAVRADFASAASQACINVRPDGAGDSGVIRAYDGVGALLASATSTPGAFQALCVSASGIRRVEFSGAGTTFARFDDLVVTLAGAPSAGAAVPTLGLPTLALLVAALAVLGVWSARRRAPRRGA